MDELFLDNIRYTSAISEIKGDFRLGTRYTVDYFPAVLTNQHIKAHWNPASQAMTRAVKK